MGTRTRIHDAGELGWPFSEAEPISLEELGVGREAPVGATSPELIVWDTAFRPSRFTIRGTGRHNMAFALLTLGPDPVEPGYNGREARRLRTQAEGLCRSLVEAKERRMLPFRGFIRKLQSEANPDRCYLEFIGADALEFIGADEA